QYLIPSVSISDQAPVFFTPQHHAIGVFSPASSRISPPFEHNTDTIRAASIAAPRQLLPAAAGSNPKSLAAVRLTDTNPAAHNASTAPRARRPREFIVGL